MNELPILRIELDGVRSNIAHMFNANNNELNEMVKASLDKTLTHAWVAERIDFNVRECIRQAVEGISNNYELRTAISEAIVDQVIRNINGDKK